MVNETTVASAAADQADEAVPTATPEIETAYRTLIVDKLARDAAVSAANDASGESTRLAGLAAQAHEKLKTSAQAFRNLVNPWLGDDGN